MTFLALVLGTVLGIILLPKDYQAEMKILVKRERVDAAVSPGRDTVMSNPGDVTEEELNSEVELLKSRDLLEKVVVSCNLQNSQSAAISGAGLLSCVSAGRRRRRAGQREENLTGRGGS